MFDLSNKIAIITGASQGIGRTMALVFAKSGANVICVARSESKIKELCLDITDRGGVAHAIACDVGDGDAFGNTIKSVTDEHGKLDILINNAGITRDALLMRMNDAQWDDVIQTNLKGAFHGMRSAIRPMMKNKYGRIINITSIVGLTGNSGQANYAASKSGLIGMTKSIAKEVASRGITVNCIAPGWIETSMTEILEEEIKNNFLNQIPIKRMGTPEDIANAVIFLASDEASYITGQTLTIDGGRIIN